MRREAVRAVVVVVVVARAPATGAAADPGAARAAMDFVRWTRVSCPAFYAFLVFDPARDGVDSRIKLITARRPKAGDKPTNVEWSTAARCVGPRSGAKK